MLTMATSSAEGNPKYHNFDTEQFCKHRNEAFIILRATTTSSGTRVKNIRLNDHVSLTRTEPAQLTRPSNDKFWRPDGNRFDRYQPLLPLRRAVACLKGFHPAELQNCKHLA